MLHRLLHVGFVDLVDYVLHYWKDFGRFRGNDNGSPTLMWNKFDLSAGVISRQEVLNFLQGLGQFLFVGVLVVAPLLAPVLLVARRHRRTASTVAYDRGMALAALAFVASLYVGLVASVPTELQEPTDSAVVAALYELPQLAGVVPPVLAVGLMYVVHRLLK